MTLQIPRLDDRSYDQLVDLLRRQLASEDWTDHNASDPGIMLLELLAWLGEMALYRMDRVPQSHRDKFLNFITDPPEPVMVSVDFAVTFGTTATATSATIGAGTLLATDYIAGRRFLFETFEDLTVVRPAAAPFITSGTTRARAVLLVDREALGVSTGAKHQVFELRPPLGALGLDRDDPAPLLTDFTHRTSLYDPNPKLEVDTGSGIPELWTAVPSLLCESERVSTHPAARHFMVEASGKCIRFGDDVFGAIPAPGAVVTCTRYRLLDGPPSREVTPPIRHALTVIADEIHHILELGVALPTGVSAEITHNTDAEGGANFIARSKRFQEGLRLFRAPYRLITERDFTRAVLEEFNAFQRLSDTVPPRNPQVLGLGVVFNMKPTSPTAPTELVDAPSHVTLVPVFAANTTPIDLLWARLRRFLDPRRLITTRLDFMEPQFKQVDITARVVASTDRSLSDLETRLNARLTAFLSITDGGFDGRGWRLGRNVYRSQVFRLLEEIDGVDHVATLVLSPPDVEGNVEIAPHELPRLRSVTLSVGRE